MVYAIIKVDGSTAVPIFRKRIPAGIIGTRVQFEFGAGWEGRSRTVVFQAGDLTKDVVLSQEDVATIPARRKILSPLRRTWRSTRVCTTPSTMCFTAAPAAPGSAAACR